MYLKIENYCLKIFVEIYVDEKNIWKYIKCCLKTKYYYIETLIKHPLTTEIDNCKQLAPYLRLDSWKFSIVYYIYLNNYF